MTYPDVASSFVYLAGLVFLFVCGMTGFLMIALEAYKSVTKRLHDAEREAEKNGGILAFERSNVAE